MLKAVILAGGQGTRLRPITENIPKPMVSVLGRPMMEHIVRHLAAQGFTDLLATLHYRPRVIRDHFGDGSDFGVSLRYTLETKPLGTAGSVKLGAEFLDETFLVVAGDALTDVDLGAFWEFHKAKNALVSICLKRVCDPGEFGVVVADEQGYVQRFLEKPGVSQVCSDTVNTGIYLIEPEVLAHVPPDAPSDFAGDLFPKLLAQKAPLCAYVAEGYWNDIGTLEQLKQSHWDWLEGKLRLPVAGTLLSERIWAGNGTRVEPDVELVAPCWIGDNARVRAGARLGPYTVVCPDVEIDVQATISRSIVMNNSFIGEASELRNALVGDGCVIEAHGEMADEAVLGAHCHLGRNVSVLPGVKVWPDKEVDGHTTLRENLVWDSLRRPSIFGSRGVNGLANLHITPEYAVALGKAFGSWAGRGLRVAAARDSHPFARLIKRAFVSGLLAVGVNVDDLEEASLPETCFITAFGRHTAGGAHIRMSDDHDSVVVIELFDSDGLPLPRQDRRKIEAAFYRGDFPKVALDSVGNLAYPGRIEDRYADHLTQHLKCSALLPWMDRVLHYCPERNLDRLLVELLGGSCVPGIQKRPGPGDGSAPRAVPYAQIAKIAQVNHKIALIIERKGEQLALVDETGAVHPPARTQELLTAAFIIGAPPDEPVFLPPDHPRFLAELAESRVRRVVLTPKDAGAQLSAVRQTANTEGVWLHLTHFYLGYGAAAGALRLLEFLGQESLGLHEFERQISVSYRRCLTLPCAWADMGRVMRQLGEQPGAGSSGIPEGLCLEGDDGWVYVLPSADLPQLEITLEATNAAALAQLEQATNYRLRSLLP